MNAEIMQLQKLLMQIQNTQILRFSDRVLIEILLKLRKRGMHLIYTLDGQEIYTPDRLKQSILTLIQQSKRIQIPEITNLLNCNEDIIQKLVIQLRQTRLIQFQEGLAMSHSFVQNTLRDFGFQLQENDSVSILDFAHKKKLPFQFTRLKVKESLQTLKGILKENSLVISKKRQKIFRARLLGRLRGASRPISLSGLEDVVQSSGEQVQTLIREGAVLGSVQENSFIPEQFVKYRREYVQQQLRTNKFIQYHQLAKYLGIRDPLLFLRQQVADRVLYYDLVCLLPSWLQQIKEEVQLSFNKAGYHQIDALAELFTQQQRSHLIQGTLKLKKVIFAGTVLIKQSFLRTCLRPFEIRSLVEAALYQKQPKKKSVLLRGNQVGKELLASKVISYQQKDGALIQQLKQLIAEGLQKKVAQMRRQIKEGTLMYQNTRVSFGKQLIQSFSDKMVSDRQFPIFIQLIRRVKQKSFPVQLDKPLLRLLAKRNRNFDAQELQINVWILSKDPSLLKRGRGSAQFIEKFWGREEGARRCEWLEEQLGQCGKTSDEK